MAMIRVGMGAEGETAVTTTPPPAPSTMDQFLQGAKTWLTPRDIPAVFSAMWVGLKENPGAVLKSPQAWGLLAVPAAALALVLGMGAAKRRRAKNPRRRVAVRRSRRRVANPRRRTGKKMVGMWVKRSRKKDGYQRLRSSVPGTRSRSRKTHQLVNLEKALFIAPPPNYKYGGPRRRKNPTRRKKNPSHLLGKNRRYMAVGHGSHKGYWAVYDYRAHKYVSPATTNYPAQVKLAARMEKDEPSYGAQKKAAAYAERRIGAIANPRRRNSLKGRARSAGLAWRVRRGGGGGRIGAATFAARVFLDKPPAKRARRPTN